MDTRPARRKWTKGKGRGGLMAQPRPQANRRLNPRWHISIIMETTPGRNRLQMPTWATPLTTPVGGILRHPGPYPKGLRKHSLRQWMDPGSRVPVGKTHCRGQRARRRAPGQVDLRYALWPVDAVLAHGRWHRAWNEGPRTKDSAGTGGRRPGGDSPSRGKMSALR